MKKFCETIRLYILICMNRIELNCETTMLMNEIVEEKSKMQFKIIRN